VNFRSPFAPKEYNDLLALIEQARTEAKEAKQEAREAKALEIIQKGLGVNKGLLAANIILCVAS